MIRPVEMQGNIQRSSDMTTIKHNEDAKGQIDQSNFQTQFHKEIEAKSEQVTKQDNAESKQNKFDAKEKGSNEYSDTKKQQKKKEEQNDGKVVIKNRGSFDIKI